MTLVLLGGQIVTLAEKTGLFDRAMHNNDSSGFSQLLMLYPECRYDGGGNDWWMKSAAMDGKLWLVELLVGLGADVNKPSNSTDSVPAPEGAIVIAAESGHADIVSYMLDRGAVINHAVNGRVRCQALAGAAIWGKLEVAKILVEAGAEVNAVWARMTPLDRAVRHNRPEVADYLRSVGGKAAAEVDPEAAAPPKKTRRRKGQ